MSGLIICTAKTACAVCLSSRTAEPVFFKLFIGLGKATHDFNSQQLDFCNPLHFGLDQKLMSQYLLCGQS